VQQAFSADGVGAGKVGLAIEVTWDVAEEGFNCNDCDDETRVLRHCTKPLKEPEAWEDYREGPDALCPPGRPEDPDDLCDVLKVPLWAWEIRDDIPHYRQMGGEFWKQPNKWHQLVAHADRLSRKAEAAWIEAKRKDKGG